jgi:hypothetical protein
MRFRFLFPLLLVAVFGVAVANDNLIRGDYWYTNRAAGANGDKADRKIADKMTDAYRLALSDSSVEEIAAEKLLAALYFKGRFAASDQKDRMQIHTEAKLLGEKMHAKYPKNKKIMSLYAVNLSLWGKEYGPLQAVREGVAGRVRDLGDSAEDYQILGRAHQLLPYIPLLLNWPDKKMANHYLNLALVQHPEDLYNSLFVAELLLDQNRFEEALNIIDVALLQGIRPDYVLEDRRARWKLKYLREQVLQKMKNASQNFPF